MKRNIHVVPSGNRWAVKKEGINKPVSTHKNQELARQSAPWRRKINQKSLSTAAMGRSVTKIATDLIRIHRKTRNTNQRSKT